MQLELPNHARAAFPSFPGTNDATVGVVEGDRPAWEDASPRSGRVAATQVGWRGILAVAIVSLSLLGQGERSRVDPRFISPSSTLETYWSALRGGDADEAWECLVEGRHQLPRPGMLWFLPPTDELTLTEFRSLPVTGGRILVSYEVRYLPTGEDGMRSFRSADELVRTRGEWRIARPIGEASMPEWQPAARSVDI